VGQPGILAQHDQVPALGDGRSVPGPGELGGQIELLVVGCLCQRFGDDPVDLVGLESP
jgi:hypothetical protein